MTDLEAASAQQKSNRALGWLSGLGLAVVPWIAAGILASIAGMVGGEAWNPEQTFPWFLLATFVAMLGWVTYGIVRIPGFRRGALPGALIAVAGVAVLLGVIALLQP